MILATQKTIDVPWNLFASWVNGGALMPNPAIIFAISLGPPHSLHKSFGYVSSDDLESKPELRCVRVAIIIQAVLFVIVIPKGRLPKVAGVEDASIRLLSPPHLPLVLIPATAKPSPTSSMSFYII